MKLDICGEKTIDAPMDQQIRWELRQLDENTNDAFAVLFASDLTYMQVAGDLRSGFILEYQQGDVDEHYALHGDRLSLEQVTEAFIEYRDGQTGWQTRFPFEKITI